MKPPKGGPAHSFRELQASNQVDVGFKMALVFYHDGDNDRNPKNNNESVGLYQ